MKMINRFNSIQNLCFALKAVVLVCFIVFSSGKAIGQDGRYVLEGIGGTPQIIGSSSLDLYPAPFLPNKKDTRVQFLYEAAETGLFLADASGYTTITSLAFHVAGFSLENLKTYEMENIKISMGHTIATYDGYGATEVWGIKMPPEGYCTWAGSANPYAEPLQLVKNSFNLVISQTGWVELQLDFPFVWDGVSSIVVEICKADSKVGSAPAFSTGRYQFTGIKHTSPSGSADYTLTRSLYSVNNNGTGTNYTTGCDMEISGSAGTYNTSNPLNNSYRKYRPNIRFTFQCAGAPKGGDAVIISENYCLGGEVLLHVVNDEKSSGLNYQWSSSLNDFDFDPIPGATGATLNVPRAEVDMWYQRAVGCDVDVMAGTRNSFPVKVKGINTWDGTFWSFGTEPTVNDPIKISGDFDTAVDGTSLLQACSLHVMSGTFTVKSGDIISIKEKLFVHEDATVIFENNASLIQENDAAVNEGKIVYKRDSQPVRLLDYTYWSSPVSGMTPSQFSSGTPANKIYHWNHLTTGSSPQTWVGGVANTPMVAGKGYIIRAPNGYPSSGTGAVFSGSFEGVPNNGIVIVPAQGELGKWNLIGNPYPAAIDIEKFLIANSSILEGTIRLWTHNSLPSAIPSYPGFSPQALNYSSDDYATYNLSGSIGFPADNTGANNATPGKFVGAGQSFMVAGRGAPAGDVIFNNEMRKKETGYDNSQFFRNGNTNLNEVEKNRLWLEVIHQNGKFNQTMVGYIEGATNDVDWGYDSKFRHTGDVKIYTFVGEDKLAIQGKALPFSPNDSIPLGLTTILSGEFLLNLYQFDNFFENHSVYLLDKYTNTFHDIKGGMYAFTSIPGTFDDRFELRFTNETLSLNPNINTKNNILCYTNDSNIVVKSKDIQMQSIMVFDGAGRLLFDKNKMDVTEITITDIAKNNQLLLVQVVTEEGIKSTQKIIF